jgi:hypothetical protein
VSGLTIISSLYGQDASNHSLMQLAPRMFNQRPFDLQSVVHNHGCPLIGAFTTKLATCTAGGHLWATCALVIRNRTSYVVEAWVKRCPKPPPATGFWVDARRFPAAATLTVRSV